MDKEDLYKPRAERYALALAAAAASDERIKELTDLLAESEYNRTEAEDQLAAVEYDENFGKIWNNTEEPPEDVEAIMCIVSGTVFLRQNNLWAKAETANTSTAMKYGWPIVGRGPFITFKDNWHLASLLKDNAKMHEERTKIVALINGASSQIYVSLYSDNIYEKIAEVVRDMQNTSHEFQTKVFELKSQVKDYEIEIEILKQEIEVESDAEK